MASPATSGASERNVGIGSNVVGGAGTGAVAARTGASVAGGAVTGTVVGGGGSVVDVLVDVEVVVARTGAVATRTRVLCSG